VLLLSKKELLEKGGVRVSTNKKILNRRKHSPLSTGRVVVASVIGLFISMILCIVGVNLYNKWIKYPDKMKVAEEKTGLYCLTVWEDNIKSISSLQDGSYIAMEVEYANGSELKVNFLKRMLSTVSYKPQEVVQKNIYGNDYINPETDSTEMVLSNIEQGESVYLSYVDYSSIEINEELLKTILVNHDVSFGCVDYENKLVNIFCEYMLSIEELPVKTVEHTPDLLKLADGSYSVGLNEDIFIDKELFSSKDFNDLLVRFSESAAKLSGVELIPTFEWQEWSNMSEEVKKDVTEPVKYSSKDTISLTWCGAYYLQNEYTVVDANGNIIQTGISANIGDGSFSSPAGLDTGVITVELVEYKDDNGNIIEEKLPIRVTLREFGVSEDAIAWFEGKDERNRGIDVSSNVQYCYYVIEVENLSKETITVKDNTALCDKNVNLSSRTGTMYGLVDTVTLAPGEIGYIESWNSSTELDRKYVIWGQDFSRKVEPVWFRVLSGNVVDTFYDTNSEAEPK